MKETSGEYENVVLRYLAGLQPVEGWARLGDPLARRNIVAMLIASAVVGRKTEMFRSVGAADSTRTMMVTDIARGVAMVVTSGEWECTTGYDKNPIAVWIERKLSSHLVVMATEGTESKADHQRRQFAGQRIADLDLLWDMLTLHNGYGQGVDVLYEAAEAVAQGVIAELTQVCARVEGLRPDLES